LKQLFFIQLDNISSDDLAELSHIIIVKLIESTTNADMFVFGEIKKKTSICFSSMIELLRNIYLQLVKRDENQSGSSTAAEMCQSIVQQLGNTT